MKKTLKRSNGNFRSRIRKILNRLNGNEKIQVAREKAMIQERRRIANELKRTAKDFKPYLLEVDFILNRCALDIDQAGVISSPQILADLIDLRKKIEADRKAAKKQKRHFTRRLKK